MSLSLKLRDPSSGRSAAKKITLAFFVHPETGAMVDRWIVERNVSESTGFVTSVIVGKLSLLTHLNVAKHSSPRGEVFDVVIDR